MKRTILGALMIGACLTAPFSLTSAHAQNIVNASAVGAFLMDLQGAVSSNDTAAVASMVSYPLQAGGKVYTSSDAVIADYDKIFTPSVKAAIAGARSSSMASTKQGMALNNGQIVFANSNGFPKIKSINPGQ